MSGGSPGAEHQFLVYVVLGRPLRWLTLLGGRANCPELPPECQGARQVLSTNFLLVAVPMAPDKGLGNVRQLSVVISGQ